MHSSCPECGAATDGKGKTCGSCGAVRYLLLDPFFSVFFTTFILQKYVVIVMKWEKEAVYFFNFKGEDELNEWKKKICALCGAIPFIFPPHSRSWRMWFLVHVLCIRSSAEYDVFYKYNFASQLTFCYLILLNSILELPRVI